MSNDSIPSEPVTTTSEHYRQGYQQALDNFAITDLLHQLKTYSDGKFDAAWAALNTQEAETLAAILIQTLAANLNGKLLAHYLEILRSNNFDAANYLSSLELPPPSTALPANFPDVEMPRFLYGDRLRWMSGTEATDWGVVVGRFYNFAPHCCRWRWCYLIWLDSDSPSSPWVSADIAWEDDLEPLRSEEAQ